MSTVVIKKDNTYAVTTRKVNFCLHLKHLENLTDEEIGRDGSYNEVACQIAGVWVCEDCFEDAADNSYFSHYIADGSIDKRIWG